MSAIPETPKTTSPASVFSWLIKNFGATKVAYQQPSNPWASSVSKDCTIEKDGRTALTKLLRSSPQWTEKEPLFFTWNEMAIDLRPIPDAHWKKHFKFYSPKKAKAFTIPYYD
jgi:hypothetical protein